MSVRDERELRELLGGLLGDIEPRSAPVFAAMRQGRGIRMRRWVAAAIGLAVIAGGAAALPAVLSAKSPAPTAQKDYHYSVSIQPPGNNAPAGLISSGTQDGHRWSIVLSGHGQSVSVSGEGHEMGTGPLLVLAGDPVGIAGGGDRVPGGSVTLVGAVRHDVSRVVLELPGGRPLTLTPVRYGNQRVVGVVIPSGIPIFRAIAYHGRREVAYSVPYDLTNFSAWWAPDQRGPARFSQTIATGVTDGHAWRFSAQFGPWGYCYAGAGNIACYGTHPIRATGGTVLSPMTCAPLGNGGGPVAGISAAQSDVREVAVALSGGTTERYQTVDVQGTRLFGYAIPRGQKVAGSTEYGAAGQVVGRASIGNCGP